MRPNLSVDSDTLWQRAVRFRKPLRKVSAFLYGKGCNGSEAVVPRAAAKGCLQAKAVVAGCRADMQRLPSVRLALQMTVVGQ